MTTMIDRYIEVAMTGVPNASRVDVERDMRAMIAELIDGRIDQSESPDIATTHALEELGDPRRLAARFDDGPRYLIGPRHFYDYVSLLKNLLAWLVPLIAAIVYAEKVLSSDSDTGTALIQAVPGALGTTLLFATQVVFWVTAGFAIYERMQPEAETSGEGWTVTDLPDAAPVRQISIGDAIWGFATSAVLAVVLVLQHQRGVDAFMRVDDSLRAPGYPDDTVVPFVNPGIPDAFWFLTLGIVIVTAVFEILKYAVGHWIRQLVVTELVLDAVWIGVAVVAALRWGLVNPEIAVAFSGDTADWLVGTAFERLLILGVILVSAWSAWEGINGYRTRHRVTRASEARAW